jgi:hypothetical protein
MTRFLSCFFNTLIIIQFSKTLALLFGVLNNSIIIKLPCQHLFS